MIGNLLVALFVTFSFAGSATALDVPVYKGRVNDFAGVLASDKVRELERKIERYEGETSNQIAILTIPSLEGDSLENFSIRVVENWKVGQKGKDNGVLILVSLNDRKIRIEVGRGLEGSLTDLVSGRIINEIMKPAFKQKDYYKGLDDAVNAIALAVKGEFKADPSVKKGDSNNDLEMYLIFLVIALLLAGVAGILHPIFGGIAGGAGTFFATSLVFHPTLFVLAAITLVGFLVGLVAKLVLGGISDVAGIGFGSSSSGSGSSGFGGGDFSGGGASGDWD